MIYEHALLSIHKEREKITSPACPGRNGHLARLVDCMMSLNQDEVLAPLVAAITGWWGLHWLGKLQTYRASHIGVTRTQPSPTGGE